jgi:predicted acyl esterase
MWSCSGRRGRYASGGRFDPYRQEGPDGYDTIEWAASQPWSNGIVGTFGLSYPGAVQWLAAMQAPPHLKAMAPAMTFSSPRNFFYANGVFDRSWLPWIYVNIAPDIREARPARLAIPRGCGGGPGLPTVSVMVAVEDLRGCERSAVYFSGLRIRPRIPRGTGQSYAVATRVTAAVLNLSGWYDEGYGPEGAATNFNGMVQSRPGTGNPRTHLILGPWIHGVGSTGERRVGDLDFGPAAAIDYDQVVLDFFDHYLRGVRNGYADASPVRHFVMGANEWQSDSRWPPAGTTAEPLYLAMTDDGRRLLTFTESARSTRSTFVADPRHPVVDLHEEYGPHDYRQLEARKDVLTFDNRASGGRSAGVRRRHRQSFRRPATAGISICGSGCKTFTRTGAQ